MTNWAERGEQERRKIAAEQARTQTQLDAAAQQNRIAADKLRGENEAAIRAKLRLFDELRIEGILREIKGSLWRGKGEIHPKDTRIGYDSGSVFSELKLKVYETRPEFEYVYKRVNGPYTGTSTTTGGTSGHISETVHHYKGWHDEHTGYKLVEVRNGLLYYEYEIEGSLSYSLPQDAYTLGIAGSKMDFGGTGVDRKALHGFVDESFLNYSAHSGVLDFDGIRVLEAERAWYQGRVGNTYKHDYDVKFPGRN